MHCRSCAATCLYYSGGLRDDADAPGRRHRGAGGRFILVARLPAAEEAMSCLGQEAAWCRPREGNAACTCELASPALFFTLLPSVLPPFPSHWHLPLLRPCGLPAESLPPRQALTRCSRGFEVSNVGHPWVELSASRVQFARWVSWCGLSLLEIVCGVWQPSCLERTLSGLTRCFVHAGISDRCVSRALFPVGTVSSLSGCLQVARARALYFTNDFTVCEPTA